MAINLASPRTSAISLLSSSILLLLISSGSSTSLGNVLKNGYELGAGGLLSIGNYKFIMQRDCNLVLYENNTVLWETKTQGKGTLCSLSLQSNGELFVFSESRKALWRSETGGEFGNYALVLQPNGNVVVYGSPMWSTGTYIQSTASNAPPRYFVSPNP
ncbi:hypothetical protein KFK09_012859 [Dendrobium nobile]|uniref:Bulb-type lectin domain-containing protein n=1 Tax=Dendrobium nobile TaxID=94219 RepID=A0A8T3BK20_DENNO|nr:hypothetical protein KFK09_012859 [Dendrobium nobile]